MTLLRREAIDQMDDPQWLIGGVLPAGAVSMIYGMSNKGKSYLRGRDLLLHCYWPQMGWTDGTAWTGGLRGWRGQERLQAASPGLGACDCGMTQTACESSSAKWPRQFPSQR
jgi:hypothetical protein